MQIAKLSTGPVVRLVKPPQPVHFAEGEWALVSNQLSVNPNRIHPYWVLSTYLVWVLDAESFIKEKSCVAESAENLLS